MANSDYDNLIVTTKTYYVRVFEREILVGVLN